MTIRAYEKPGRSTEKTPGEAAMDVNDPNFWRIAMELVRLANDGYDTDDPETVRFARHTVERNIKRRTKLTLLAEEVREATPRPGEWVYYMRLRDTIKIGFSANVERRKRDLYADEILAVEPGGYALESARHRQFRHLNIPHLGSERFESAPDLLAHIDSVRRTHGECWLDTA